MVTESNDRIICPYCESDAPDERVTGTAHCPECSRVFILETITLYRTWKPIHPHEISDCRDNAKILARYGFDTSKTCK